MHSKAISSPAWPADLAPRRGILVLQGYGLDVRVWRGRLRVADGIGADRREAIVHRATGGLRRLVVLGHTGTVTLDAIRWLADVGAGYLQIDADGRVLASFGPQGTDRPHLRRSQASALDTALGDGIARRLVAEKIAAQAETLAAVDRLANVTDVTVRSMRVAADALHVAVGRDEIRRTEAAAAAAYWSAWSAVTVRFAGRDPGVVPEHWRIVGGRSSALTGAPRVATNPANALLNYLYALLEGEAAIAARIVGLDPGLGVLHADLDSRDSLASDLMEPIRPRVDRFVLDLLAERSFATADFHETRQGSCRITSDLARELAATSPVWGRLVGRVAEDVARLLTDPNRSAPPTPITGRRRAAARPSGPRPRLAKAFVATVPPRCTSCGQPTAGRRQTCSDGCARDAADDNSKSFAAAGAVRLAELRDAGFQRDLGPAARRRIGTRASELLRAAREWQRTHAWPDDMRVFCREILPLLHGATAREIAFVTGLSIGYCRRVKSGVVTPHPMWWESLRALADERLPTGA